MLQRTGDAVVDEDRMSDPGDELAGNHGDRLSGSVAEDAAVGGAPAARNALDDLLQLPLHYPASGPAVEYGPPGPGVDAHTADALLALLGGSVHADLEAFSKAIFEGAGDEHELPQPPIEVDGADRIDTSFPDEVPHSPATDDHQDLDPHDAHDFYLPNEVYDH